VLLLAAIAAPSNKSFAAERKKPRPLKSNVHGGYAAVNRGADSVKCLVPSLRARTRHLTGHREPHNQATLACMAPGAGQHRDSAQIILDNVYVMTYI